MWSHSAGNAFSSGKETVELPVFLPLTALYVGRFASTNHAVTFLWVRGFGRDKGSVKQLVLVVVQDDAKMQPAATLQRSWFMRRNPFFAPGCGEEDARPFRGCVAFEIDLDDIVGLDYLNPLIVDASRLVIEASRMKKLWFPNLKRCSTHYEWHKLHVQEAASSDCGGNLQTRFASLLSDLYTPCTGEDGRAPGLPQLVPQSEHCRQQTSPSKPPQYWQQGWEEGNYKRLNKVVLTAERLMGRKNDASPTTATTARNLCGEFTAAAEASGVIANDPPGEDNASDTLCSDRPCEACPAEHDGDGGTGGILEEEVSVNRRPRSDSEDSHVSQASQGSKCATDIQPVIEVLYNLTVNFRFDDPFMPYVLREVVHDPERPQLLRLCEAGLPAWAIYLPQYTGLYRRYMRHIMAAVLLLLSCVSMLLGFYDLYKRIPAVRSLLKQMLGPLTSRLEDLVVVRLSVLLGWMLPYSAIFRRSYDGFCVLLQGARQLFGGIFSFLSSFAALIGSALGPGFSVLVQPVISTVSAGGTLLSTVFSAARGAVWAVGRVAGASETGAAAQLTTTGLLHAEFKMLRQAAMGIYNGICFLGVSIAKHQASMRLAFARWRMHTRQRIVKAVKRRPLCTTCLVLLTAWYFRPPGVRPGVGHHGMWGIDGPASRWLESQLKGLDETGMNLSPLVAISCSSKAAGPLPREFKILVTDWQNQQRQQPTTNNWRVLANHRCWWWWGWDAYLAPTVCPLILPAAKLGAWDAITRAFKLLSADGAALSATGSKLLQKLAPKWQDASTAEDIEGSSTAVRHVDLVCQEPRAKALSNTRCWDSVRGGRRCHCPYETMLGLNFTMNRCSFLTVGQPTNLAQSGFATPLIPLCGPSGRSSFVDASRLSNIFRGGVAELWALPHRRPRISSPETSAAAIATFVVEAPKKRASPPREVSLCSQGSADGKNNMARFLFIPKCGPKSLSPGEVSAEDGKERVVVQHLSNTSGFKLRVTWLQGDLQHCQRPKWSASLELGHNKSTLLCRELGQSYDQPSQLQLSCSGWKHILNSVDRATMKYGVRAVVALTCLESSDEPLGVAVSSRYTFRPILQPRLGSLHALTPLFHARSKPLVFRSGWPVWASFCLSLAFLLIAAWVQRAL
eukprot:TRINITY_DN64970_c0_g1_i1.p1 TRINITY_DN64970_c0_g1~~TRINITY_DN64970_c0_g1_i1.p1  ORF type:complete len:1132 (-),score=160.24 TRINITY_DN64970_c0_g1_i1:263-3658(-)